MKERIGVALAVWVLAAGGGCPEDVHDDDLADDDLADDDDAVGDDDSGAGDDDSGAGDDDSGAGDDDTTAGDGVWDEIDVIGGEVVVGSVSGFRSVSVAVDSLDQPHVFLENYGSGLYAFHELGGDWQGEEPWFVPGGTLGSVHAEIDAADRAWVSFTSFVAGDAELTGEWVALVGHVAHAPGLLWAENIRPYTGFSGNLSIDPYFPDSCWRMGGQPHPTYRFDDEGNYVQDVTLSPGASGEGIRFRIAPNQGGAAPGVWHAATGIWNAGGLDGGYHNTARLAQGLGPVPWIAHTYPQSGDSFYPSIGVDAVDPEVAYLAGTYEGLLINIWDGSQMLFPIDALPVLDGAIAEYGNGVGRFTPVWAAARGGGAFLCWTGADLRVKVAHVSTAGGGQLGPVTDVGPGTRCAIDVDAQGYLHLVFDNGGIRYRLLTTR